MDDEECKSDEDSDYENDNHEEDDGFIVQHGYLSSWEGSGDEKRSSQESKYRKNRMKKRAEEFKMGQKLRKQRNLLMELIPHCYGPCFSSPGDDIDDNIKDQLFPGIILHYND